MSSQEKKNTFFGGAAILAMGVALTKVIGAFFKIPLISILSDEAYGDFGATYNIYNLFLTISTAGLPVALSKTISEANALGRTNQVQKLFRVAFVAFLTMGLFSFFCMTVLSAPLSSLVLRNPKAVYCILALSPSVLCVCIMSAFRGYFQGHFHMTPVSVSQVIESFLKLIVGLGLAIFFLSLALQPVDFGNRMGAVGALIGVSFGSVAALLYMIFVYLKHRGKQKAGTDKTDSSKSIFINLLKLAIPITIGSGASSLITMIDTSLVMGQLQSVYLAAGATATDALDTARGLYGVYSKCMSVYNLPFSMMVPLTACIIPAVSAALARRDRLGAQSTSESALRIGVLVAMPMGFGLFALGGPIMNLLGGLDVTVAGPLMSVLGLASIFVSIQLLCNSILQANGMVNLPILVVAIGGVAKIIINYILVGNPDIQINGAPIGTLSCFAIMVVLDIFIIHRTIPAPPRFAKAIIKPLIASAVMGAAAWATYGLLTNVLHLGNAISTIGGIGVGGVIYLVLVLALRVISREDLELMPKGDKIAKILHIS